MLKLLSLLAALVFFALAVTHLIAKPAKLRDIADTITANPITTKFNAVMQSADLITFLSSRGPFTVFVPTDSAFSKIPPDTMAELLRPENKERLQHILLFHVINDKKFSAKDLLTQTNGVPSCEGTLLTFKQSRLGTQLVMKAKIVHADIHCLNGVIHQIDTVLMPPETNLPPLATAPPPPPLSTNIPSALTNAPSTMSNPSDTNAPSAETNAPPSDTNAAPFSTTNVEAATAAPAVAATNSTILVAPVAPPDAMSR